MIPRERRASSPRFLILLAGAGWLAASGCTRQDEGSSSATAAATRKVPRLGAAPAAPRMMQVYFNTETRSEWIYDGAQWVPHDDSVADFYEAQARKGGTARPLGSLLDVSSVPGTFAPTGAHVKHDPFACTACHAVAGSPCFDPAGPAVAPRAPSPAFDAGAKTCSSVACHGAYSGTFTYDRYDFGSDTYLSITYAYAGSGGSAPSWYSTGGLGCASCHGNPPGPGPNWHSPTHGAGLAAARKCETCHPDATSAVVGARTVGVAIVAAQASLHGNGVANVQPLFTSKCFVCH